MVVTLKIKFQFIKHLDKFHLHRKKQRKHLPPFLQTEKRSKFALFKAMAAAAACRGRLTGVDLSLESYLLYDVAQSKLQ